MFFVNIWLKNKIIGHLNLFKKAILKENCYLEKKNNKNTSASSLKNISHCTLWLKINGTCYISFIKCTTGFSETRNTTQYINYLGFCWNEVSRKGVVVGENTSVVSKKSYLDCIAFIHWQYHSSWTTFKSCMSWGNLQDKMTVFYDFDSYVIRTRGHFGATENIKSSSGAITSPDHLLYVLPEFVRTLS